MGQFLIVILRVPIDQVILANQGTQGNKGRKSITLSSGLSCRDCLLVLTQQYLINFRVFFSLTSSIRILKLYAHIVELNCCCRCRSSEGLFPQSCKNGIKCQSATSLCHCLSEQRLYETRTATPTRTSCAIRQKKYCFHTLPLIYHSQGQNKASYNSEMPKNHSFSLTISI